MNKQSFQPVFHSLLPVLPKAAARAASHLLGFDQLEAAYQQLKKTDEPAVDWLLTHLNVRVQVAELDRGYVPKAGACVVVSNHPTGILDGAVLGATLRQIRPDVRILGNHLLASLPELADLVIPIDVLSGVPGSAGLRQALRFLKNGGLLVVFPSGVVSRFDWKSRGVSDPLWQQGTARLIELATRTGAAPVIVPVHIAAANSALFHAVDVVHPKLRTVLLLRELWNKNGATVKLRIGKPVDADRLLGMPEPTEYLRWRVDLLGGREAFKPRTRSPLFQRSKLKEQVPVELAQPAEALADEVAALPAGSMLIESGDLRAYLARAAEAPSLLREIGRLREITFRAAGEGTGKSTDLDSFDQDYLHLFIWNTKSQEIAGAYRLAPTDQVANLYTAQLFGYGDAFRAALGPALELGRSFICQKYQRGFAPLLLLWKGIGKFVAANPQYRVLFGPVSISNQYQELSRDLMLSFLERTASLPEWKHLIQPGNPAHASMDSSGCADVDELSDLISEIEPNRAGLPVLLRQYLRLGGKLVGFNIDPEFSDALDGLILVDLTRTESKLLDRYLGKTEAGIFRCHQKGNHATLTSICH